MLNLSTKERLLLEDEKSHETLCVSKYNDYATRAKYQELQHLDSINQILSGTVPNVNAGGQNF